MEFFFIKSMMALISLSSTAFSLKKFYFGFTVKKAAPNFDSALINVSIRKRLSPAQIIVKLQSWKVFHTKKQSKKPFYFAFLLSLTKTDASTAKIYDFSPKPMICPQQTGA